MGRLDGKVAIITGAAQGTGAAMARRFVAEGARVVLGDVQEERGRAVADDLGEAARFVLLDVREEAGWSAAVDAATTGFGGVDVLVNNAGVLLLKGIDATTRADLLRLVEVNQLGPYLGIRRGCRPRVPCRRRRGRTVTSRCRASGSRRCLHRQPPDGLAPARGRRASARRCRSDRWRLGRSTCVGRR
jgi:NAD(P)-dependent dehydrogenase (short-subunit alcohol dehydrogenase family)